ncbi:MAG: DUF4124 domain-containing protein [Gammaproteobacteria bacterium]|jgi:hypothetical protein
MRLVWILLGVIGLAALYFYQNPQHLPHIKELSSEVGISKKTARLYKWQNEKGEWQYTDEPPPEGIAYEKLELREDENVLPLPPKLGGEQ